MKLESPCYCPSCGKKNFFEKKSKMFECSNCSFTFFKNVASAVGVIIHCNGKILLTRRAKAPGKGLLDIPGGFCEENETPEKTAKREIKEELNLNISELSYFVSFPNRYPYKDILYHTMDLIYTCNLNSFPDLTVDDEEINHIEWFDKKEIPINKIAFSSIKKALKLFQKYY